VLSELLELRSEDWNEEDDSNRRNWFSPTNSLRVYSQYLELDVDHDGMLSKTELLRYGHGSFTQVFVDRVFEECHTYDGKMDYKTFLDFVLAIENSKSQPGLYYFWRLLDVEHCGYINTAVINYFFREIVQRMVESGHDAVRIPDVVDEIFDMVNPKDPTRITFKDLIACGVGDIIVSMLTDTNGFIAYDHRESLISSSSSNEEEDT
jgi:serine/threonine-protein phosphatase 2A regulatory subunit B''